ncbi:hypothetical protein R6Q57_002284 [Mikania cordata]
MLGSVRENCETIAETINVRLSTINDGLSYDTNEPVLKDIFGHYGEIIEGLSYDTNEPVLKDIFGHYGEIIEVKVICDHKSGKSKGYGFVHYISEDSASKALAEMDDQVLDGRNIRIQYANKK